MAAGATAPLLIDFAKLEQLERCGTETFRVTHHNRMVNLTTNQKPLVHSWDNTCRRTGSATV